MLDPLSIIQVGCPTCCYQVCALDHAKGGDADLDYPSEPCHRKEHSLYHGTLWTAMMWFEGVTYHMAFSAVKPRPCDGGRPPSSSHTVATADAVWLPLRTYGGPAYTPSRIVKVLVLTALKCPCTSLHPAVSTSQIELHWQMVLMIVPPPPASQGTWNVSFSSWTSFCWFGAVSNQPGTGLSYESPDN